MSSPKLILPKVQAVSSADDPVWKHAFTQPMLASEEAGKPELQEPGRFSMIADEEAIWLKLEMTDRDVVSTATADHQYLWELGDLAEWFIGVPPGEDGTHGTYVELHVNPHGHRSAYQWQRPGLLEDWPLDTHHAEAIVHGQANDLASVDSGWDAVFRLPWASLHQVLGLAEAAKASPDDGLVLSTLVSRYNYGQHLRSTRPELSMWPMQPRDGFHLRPSHAEIVIKEIEKL